MAFQAGSLLMLALETETRLLMVEAGLLPILHAVTGSAILELPAMLVFMTAFAGGG